MKEIEAILAAEKEAQRIIEKAQRESEGIVAKAKEEALTFLAKEKARIDVLFNMKMNEKLAAVEQEKKGILREAERKVAQLDKKARKRMPEVEDILLRKIL